MPISNKIICTVTNDLNHDQRMRRIATTLSDNGYKVILVGRKKKTSKPLELTNYEQKRLNCWAQRGKLFYVEFNIRLFFYLLFQRFDVVNAIDLDTIIPCLVVSRLKRKFVTYDAHEYFSEVPEVMNRPFTKKVWESIAAFCIPKMDCCYTVGTMLAELFKERYKISFSVVRNVPFQTNQKKTTCSENKILIYQGALNTGRGLEAIISAMSHLPENYHLWIAGDGDIAVDLKKMANSLALTEQRIIFWGMLSMKNLQELTLQADVGVNLLEINGLSYYYSLSNKTFDYIQAHLPSLNIAFPEYIALNKEYETSVLVEKLDVVSITSAILNIFEPHVYKKLQQNCVEAAKYLNWEIEQKQLLAIYNTILS